MTPGTLTGKMASPSLTEEPSSIVATSETLPTEGVANKASHPPKQQRSGLSDDKECPSHTRPMD